MRFFANHLVPYASAATTLREDPTADAEIVLLGEDTGRISHVLWALPRSALDAGASELLSEPSRLLKPAPLPSRLHIRQWESSGQAHIRTQRTIPAWIRVLDARPNNMAPVDPEDAVEQFSSTVRRWRAPSRDRSFFDTNLVSLVVSIWSELGAPELLGAQLIASNRHISELREVLGVVAQPAPFAASIRGSGTLDQLIESLEAARIRSARLGKWDPDVVDEALAASGYGVEDLYSLPSINDVRGSRSPMIGMPTPSAGSVPSAIPAWPFQFSALAFAIADDAHGNAVIAGRADRRIFTRGTVLRVLHRTEQIQGRLAILDRDEARHTTVDELTASTR